MHDAPTPPATPALDVAAIRAAFPALRRRLAGRPVAYFDGPGGTQVPSVVPEAMADYLLHHNANTHWAYPTSAETDALIADARATLGDYLNAPPDAIAFGANMTTLTFHVARALGRSWGPDDEVIVTLLDHQANVAPWKALARERGVRIRTVPFDRATGELDWSVFEAMTTPNTRLIAVGAASNALGTVNDIPRAAALARRVGALLFVDAVHAAAHGPLDVEALGCDLLACSPYKFYGPHLGVLYGRPALLETLDVPRLDPAPDYAPDRIETGTLSHEAMVGAAAAVEFLADLGTGRARRERLLAAGRAIHAQGQHQVERLWQGFSRIPAVTLYGPSPDRPRTPTLSFSIADVPSEHVTRVLAEKHAVFTSHGDFYASGVTAHLGLTERGLVRAGCALYTTDHEIDRLVDGVRSIADSL